MSKPSARERLAEAAFAQKHLPKICDQGVLGGTLLRTLRAAALGPARLVQRRRARDREIQALIDRSEITDVLRRYATAVDRLDIELLRSCFHPDYVDEHGEWKGTLEEFLVEVPSFLSRFQVTMHLLGLPRIDLRGDVASVETYAIAWHRRSGSRKDDVWGVRYFDTFERRSGEWRISHRQMKRDWRRVDPPTDRDES